jgi:DNA-binding NarL/FixJ family response regulator
MIRVAVYSRDETFHRAILRVSRGDVAIDLRLRSVAELRSTGHLDVLVIDESDPESVEELVGFVAPLPVVLVRADCHAPAARRAWRQRTDGWAEIAGRDAGRVVAAARLAADGMVVTDPGRIDADADDGAVTSTEAADDPLTPREHEVLELLARGMSNTDIASELAVSANTVKYHVSSVLAKLDAGSRSEATWQAVRRGLVSI